MQWSATLNNLLSSTAIYLRGVVERFTGKSWLHKHTTVQQPLLNDKNLQQIYAVATSSANERLFSQHEVKTLMVGERSSVYSGSGYEFADNVRYVAGDDSRFINWRMLARTGKLYRKVFNEERRPQVWIVSDKRASMRFGSKKRLKVTQAVIHALCYLYQSHQQQLACGGVVLDEKPYWFNPSQNMNALQPLIEKLIAPAPPLISNAANLQFDVMLRQLAQRLSSGSIIILISDFHDLNQNLLGTLHTLASHHTVVARHIIDPLEEKLPQQGKYQVTSQQAGTVQVLDCENASFRFQYETAMKKKMEGIENQLVQAGIHYQRCPSDQNIIDEAKP